MNAFGIRIVVMPWLDHGIHSVSVTAGYDRYGVDCMLAVPPMRWRRRRVLVEWMGLSDRGNLEARRRHGLTRERSLGLDARMAIRRADQNRSLPEEAMTDKTIVGSDISKDWIDVAVAGARHVKRLDNTAEAIGDWLDRSAPTAVVGFEPTGVTSNRSWLASEPATLSHSGFIRTPLSPSARAVASAPRPTASMPD
jgi:hypothetical protein